MVNNVEIYVRDDGRWEWRARAGNGEIVAVSGNQGYENRSDCVDTVEALFPGIRHND
jgi:uncharacterized protein YegP (UPF0339 family)